MKEERWARAAASAASLTHEELVRRAERWLLNSIGCTVVPTDHPPRVHGEMPDALGFKPLANQTVLVEAKTSRFDFLADAKKPWRATPGAGFGSWRYYLCPPRASTQPTCRPAGDCRGAN